VTSYPPEPWDLHGHAYIGLWLLPRDRTPAPGVPGVKVVRVLGRSIVAAAFFRYEEPSPLTYDEIMATVLTRQGLRPRVTITDIWVDSPASMAGGRELWAIPKDLAEFDVLPHHSYASDRIGSLALGRRRRLPFMLPMGFRLAQERDGRAVVSPVRGRIRCGLVRARWSFAPEGRLGFLAGRRPLLTVAATPFHILFGHR
jgi:hypothetical protein